MFTFFCVSINFSPAILFHVKLSLSLCLFPHLPLYLCLFPPCLYICVSLSPPPRLYICLFLIYLILCLPLTGNSFSFQYLLVSLSPFLPSFLSFLLCLSSFCLIIYLSCEPCLSLVLSLHLFVFLSTHSYFFLLFFLASWSHLVFLLVFSLTASVFPPLSLSISDPPLSLYIF